MMLMFNYNITKEVASVCVTNTCNSAGITTGTWAVGDGFQDLHWNMLSWFGCCTKVLRCFLLRCVVRVVVRGCMLCLGRAGVAGFVGEYVCGVVASRCRAFFGGFVLRRGKRVDKRVGCG